MAERHDRRGSTPAQRDDASARGREPVVDDRCLPIRSLAPCCGRQFIVIGGESIAAAYGVSQFVIGATVIAVGTSVPELATTRSQ